MKEPSAPLGSAPVVPAFLMKLWALLEDPSNSDVITWNWDGQNFCIMDDQRFSKEILPKYFKHNNLSSFIRQLNMYGFRKVMSLESGLVRPERGSAIEFQHPFFKRGKVELLDQIKRKMSSSVRPAEDPHLSQEELQKVVFELQDLKDVQSNMDVKLETMRRENEALWKEVSSLRRKHSQQQKLLTKILQFILGLMKGNIVMAPKRKRQLTLEPVDSPPKKYSRNVLQFPEGLEEEVLISSPQPGHSADDTLQIHEILGPGEGTSEPVTQAAEQAQSFTTQPAIPIAGGMNSEEVQQIVIDDSVLQSLSEQSALPGSSAGLTLDVVPSNPAEDSDSVINSILNESNSSSGNELLYREDIQDFLSCIDASLEELQVLLSKKKLHMDSDFIDEEPLETQGGASLPTSDEQDNKDRQLVQYTGNPVLSLFDLPSGSYGPDAVDPDSLLTTFGEEYGSGSAMHNDSLPGCSSQAPGLLAEDFAAPQEVLPLFVLSPVSKLLDEAKETDAL